SITWPFGPPYSDRRPSRGVFLRYHEDVHHVSTQVRFLPSRGLGGGAARSALITHWRESIGSITSSISRCDAILMPFPCWYSFATICSNSALRATGSSTASSSLR